MALSEESRHAIDAVDWRTIILGMRAEKGYSYAQLEDLELETELLLCGLINPEDYPKELEKRMGIPKAKIDELVNELNEKVFKKIREELVKTIERKKMSENSKTNETKENFKKEEEPIESREELLKNIENTSTGNVENIVLQGKEILAQKELPVGNKDKQENKGEPLKNSPRVPLGNSILEQKLSGAFQIPTTETNHSLGNLSSSNKPSTTPKVDPYREPTE